MAKSHLPTFKNHRRWTVDEARSALAAQGASGLSTRAFAQREGLDAQRLYRWRRQFEAEPRVAPVAFFEVQPRRAERIEVVLRSGRVLRVAESVDIPALVRIADALDEAERC